MYFFATEKDYSERLSRQAEQVADLQLQLDQLQAEKHRLTDQLESRIVENSNRCSLCTCMRCVTNNRAGLHLMRELYLCTLDGGVYLVVEPYVVVKFTTESSSYLVFLTESLIVRIAFIYYLALKHPFNTPVWRQRRRLVNFNG